MPPINFQVFLNTLRQKGNLAYEYNPLHNYQTDVDLCLIDDTYIIPKDQAINKKNGELLTKNDNNQWIDKRGRIINTDDVIEYDETKLWASAGSLIDLDTDKLNFDLDHPVGIEVQPSYDGSVNLIINDDKNIPRLINSRFSVREKDTYEIVDRIGENDTNIYNSKTFDKDTSLYFQYEYNPIINYLGFVKGILPVGQYCFYFTYCDADDNESDFIAETGLIPVFLGNDQDPRSMDGGIKNQISNKGISLRLNNIDKSYNYIKVYYVRYFADYQQNRVYECKKIYKRYPVNSGTLYLQITGYEEAEDLDANILNLSRFNPKSILTQAQCKNMLFFGNIVKNTDNYRELTDLALRIIPELNVSNNFDTLDSSYISNNGDFAYYNSLNIYNKTGYFNQEYYRFGVVFIYQNGTLSNVYNTLGGILESENNLNLSGDLYRKDFYQPILIRNYVKTDDYGWIKADDSYTTSGKYLNGKGVCQLNYTPEYDDSTIFSVKFKVPKEVSKCLREDLGIRGLFFVRQKCTPNILAQCYLLNMDDVLEAPILEEGTEDNKSYYTECFIGNDGTLRNDISSRLYKYELKTTGMEQAISSKAYAAICPDFSLNQPYYNQIFNGGKFKLQKISKKDSELTRTNRFFNENLNTKYNISEGYKKVEICTVTEDVPTVAIQDKIYRLEIGETEEAFRFQYAEVDNGSYNAGEEDFDKINGATNIVRGKYSPYLAIYSNSGKLETGCLYNILQDSSISIKQEFQNRMDSSEPFYSIGDRYNIVDQDTTYECFRGDCYINQYTHRMIRNFNDPSLPNNDTIIDRNTWKDYYRAENPEEWENISRSDVNAVQLGTWITFRVRSAMNYALRSVDHSYVSEEALMGSPRSFYPKSHLLQRGENKLPDSALYNDAYRASLGYKCYFTLQDINYIKDTFSNRIQYSAIAIQDSYKNNYRVSLSTYFRDYSQEYGSITKLVELNGNLVVVFEHGIGVAAINERVLAGEGAGGSVFINSQNVLPEELNIITNTYGTQWSDSVIKSEAGYIYGVDTIAKKIWRFSARGFELISDFKVNKFLIDNITLGERELYPTVGLKNVKTHYNNNKKDVIFTFYDDIYEDEEKAWSLCFNEMMGDGGNGAFITFYSWIPSYSENIDTKFFTFDRETSKSLSLLGKCNYSIPENTGVLVDSPVINNDDDNWANQDNEIADLYYITKDKSQVINYTILNDDGTTSQKSVTINDTIKNNQGQYVMNGVDFRLERDHWGNYKMFKLDKGKLKINLNNPEFIKNEFNRQKVILLYITPIYSNIIDVVGDVQATTQFHTEVVALTLSSIVKNPLLTPENRKESGLTTDFYLHGQAGIFNVIENLYPTRWYGKFHPFEFEFAVNDKIAQQKIFTNLMIISNKAEPESFHFEIEGDNYEFSEDKRTMYFRQEATKEFYQNLGSDILFNRKYTDVVADNYTYEQYYRSSEESRSKKKNPSELSYLEDDDYINVDYDYSKIDRVYPIYSHGLKQQKKSTIFPLYYERIDTYNDIYHKYHLMHDDDGVYDFEHLSGSEVAWNRDLNQFNIITHIKNRPIDHFGRLRGNSKYTEGKWNIQIPPISFMQKNEPEWRAKEFQIKNEFILCESELCEGNVLACKCDNNNCDPNKGQIKLPPIVINSQYVPKDITNSSVTLDKIPNIYTGYMNYIGDNIEYPIPREYTLPIDPNPWTYRKETKIRDKWIKIRIRYSGKNLAIIHSLITLYNISYS